MYRELKGEIEFEGCLKYVQGALLRSFYKFHSGTHGLFEYLSQHAGGDGSQDYHNWEAGKDSPEHVHVHVLLNVHHKIPKDNFFKLPKTSASFRCI